MNKHLLPQARDMTRLETVFVLVLVENPMVRGGGGGCENGGRHKV